MSVSVTSGFRDTPCKRHMRELSHWLVLIASIILIVLISWDAFNNISFISNPQYLKVQFWICLFFIVDIIVEFFLYPLKWKFIVGHIFFLLVSVPYTDLISYFEIQLNPDVTYIIQLVPMIRTAYVLVIVLTALTSNRISGLFVAYLTLLLSIVYFSALMFFIEEHFINPSVDSFWSALWWAFMCCNTVGSNIEPITQTGIILQIVLSLSGLLLFPVFTVYITNALTSRKNVSASVASPK